MDGIGLIMNKKHGYFLNWTHNLIRLTTVYYYMVNWIK